MLPLSVMPDYWKWAYYGGFHTYSFESFMFNQFHDTNKQILRTYEIEDVDIATHMIILTVYATVIQFIFFLVVYFVHTGRE